MEVFRISAGEHDSMPDDMDAVAIRPDVVESMEELELAFHLARSAFEKKKNIAKRLKYEFLLWLSGSKDIDSAIRKTEPEGEEFLLVMFSGKKPGKLKEKKLRLKKHADALRLERISLSRIRS